MMNFVLCHVKANGFDFVLLDRTIFIEERFINLTHGYDTLATSLKHASSSMLLEHQLNFSRI